MIDEDASFVSLLEILLGPNSEALEETASNAVVPVADSIGCKGCYVKQRIR